MILVDRDLTLTFSEEVTMTFGFGIDWRHDFVFSVSPLDIIFRGVVVYIALFALLRLILKREVGTVGITDLLVVVLLGDAAQNAMSEKCKTVTDGLVLVATIIFCAYSLDWLGYHFPGFDRFVHPPALPLVKDGVMMRQNMRHELITADELKGLLREQGVEDLSNVKVARMEGDGQISVICHEGQPNPPKEKET
jgi:uncharacterized membrane protein YcaP (DUF421 family)